MCEIKLIKMFGISLITGIIMLHIKIHHPYAISNKEDTDGQAMVATITAG